jgi:Helix-turn-helix
MDHAKQELTATGFPDRLRQVIAEFGSRYALAKSSRIPASTLQSYEAGSKPGMDALTTLARVANVDLNWLVTGQGAMRPPGLLPGAALADFVVVDQYEMGTALNMSVVIGQLPFSRHYLESRLRLRDPSNETLLVVEADANLFGITRGDLVLVDRNQHNLARDGIYLLDLPGILLRAVTRGLGDKVRVTEPETDAGTWSTRDRRGGRPEPAKVDELRLSDLLGSGRFQVSKVVGRAVSIIHAI